MQILGICGEKMRNNIASTILAKKLHGYHAVFDEKIISILLNLTDGMQN